MLTCEERRYVVGELKTLEGTLEGPEMLGPPTMEEQAESSEAMLGRPRILTLPAVEEELEWLEATTQGLGVLAPDKKAELPEEILDGPGPLTPPTLEIMEDANVVHTDEILEALDTVRGGVGGCPESVRPSLRSE